MRKNRAVSCRLGGLTSKYRWEGVSLFEYSFAFGAYMCVYRSAGKTKDELISEYGSLQKVNKKPSS